MSTFTVVYFLRGTASGFGLGTQADPYRVLSGSAGNAQIHAFLDTIEGVQGTRPTAREVPNPARAIFSPRRRRARARYRR